MSDLIRGHRTLSEFDGLVACGGFPTVMSLAAVAVGLRPRCLMSKCVSNLPIIFAVMLVLGVCNGCQMLAQMAELILGPNTGHALGNSSEQFEGRTVMVNVATNASLG